MKLLAIATHPIQYQAPWFRELAKQPELELAVAFAALPDAKTQGAGFSVPFEWDLPLLEGYRSRSLQLSTKRPDLDRLFGLRAAGPRRVLEEEAPAVVLLTGWNSWILVQFLGAARISGIPIVVRGESNALRPRPVRVRLVHRLLLRQFAAFLAIGCANRRFYLSNGVAKEELFDCPYFVDNARFDQQAGDLAPGREELRATWGVLPGDCCVLFAGKHMAKKRPLDLIRAAARARRDGARLHLLLAGDGELRPILESAAAEFDVPVSFAGFLNQSEIARAYVAADLLTLPSDAGETWGLVVNEAMACGRPAIVSDLVGCREDLVVEGETGWSYPCGEVEALANLLRRAAADRPRLKAMGELARRRVTSDYSVERAVEGTLRACEFVLSKSRR